MRKFFIAFALALMSTLVTQSAHAETITETYIVEGTHEEVYTPGALSDLQTMAKQYGQTLEQVIYEVGPQYATDELQEHLVKGQSLRNWWDTPAETGTRTRLHLVVGSTPSPEFLSQIALLSTDTILEVCSDCLSQQQLSDLNVELFYKIHAQFPTMNFSMAPAKRDNVLEIEIDKLTMTPQSGEGETTSESSQTSLAEVTDFVAGMLPANVEAKVTDGTDLRLIGQTAAISGGDVLTSAPCTGGFVGIRLQQVGIISTNHCDSIKVVYQNKPVLSTVNTSPSQGDMSFSRVSANATADFQADVNVIKSVTFVEDKGLGQRVCKFGVITAKTCGAIVQVDKCTIAGTISICHLSKLDSNISQAGDSGGPVYQDTTAVGILWGLVAWNGFDVTAFSMISGLTSIGAHVVTLAEVILG